VSIVHLINRRSQYSSQSKDYEFSRATIRALWAAGLADMRKTLANPDWRHACKAAHGMRSYDLLR
jgi:NTE family protein